MTRAGVLAPPLLGSDPISDSQLRDSAGFAPVFPDHRV